MTTKSKWTMPTESEAAALRPLAVMGVLVSSGFLGFTLGTWGTLIFGPLWFVNVVCAAAVWLPPRPDPVRPRRRVRRDQP